MVFRHTQQRAGTYAEKRYRQGLRRWRAKTRPLLLAFFGPFILVGVAVLILDGHILSWSAGAIAGIFTGAWIAFRESPPAYIENWHEGAEGERKTERALAPLKQHGWRIVHDVKARYGNYDHIAVGPGGVFLLKSKNLQGIVELCGGMPRLRRRHDPNAAVSLERIRPRTLMGAASLKKELERRSGQRTWVQAVIVFWSDFPEGVVDDGRCIFVHGSRLHPLMHGRANRLSDNEVEEIASAIAEMASQEPVDDPQEAFQHRLTGRSQS